jgi:hypothetical protein
VALGNWEIHFNSGYQMWDNVMPSQLKKNLKIGIIDGGILRHGNPFISDLVSMLLEDGCNDKYSTGIFVEQQIEPFYQKLKDRQCDVPILGFNPYIKNIDEVWNQIAALPEYPEKKFIFISNMGNGYEEIKNGVVKPYFRENCDFLFGLPFSFKGFLATIETYLL